MTLYLVAHNNINILFLNFIKEYKSCIRNVQWNKITDYSARRLNNRNKNNYSNVSIEALIS